MAIAVACIYQGRNRLAYLLTQDGAAGTTATITSTGAATPDLRTDSIGGLITALARAATDGFGSFAAGALTQAQARALWLSDWTAAAAAGPGPAGAGPMSKTAICKITPQTGAVVETWLVDANVSAGNPIISISSQAGAGTAKLDIFVPSAIGA